MFVSKTDIPTMNSPLSSSPLAPFSDSKNIIPRTPPNKRLTKASRSLFTSDLDDLAYERPSWCRDIRGNSLSSSEKSQSSSTPLSRTIQSSSTPLSQRSQSSSSSTPQSEYSPFQQPVPYSMSYSFNSTPSHSRCLVSKIPL